MSDSVRFYGTFAKVADEKREVSGYASTEAIDADGEVILKSALAGALDDYLKFACVREMHAKSAVGIAEHATLDDKGLYIVARIVDNLAWKKVKKGVYKGFSIGGKVISRDAKNRKIITKVSLYEISLVDRPSNPEAVFDVWKSAGAETRDEVVKRTLDAMSEEDRAMTLIKAGRHFPRAIGH